MAITLLCATFGAMGVFAGVWYVCLRINNYGYLDAIWSLSVAMLAPLYALLGTGDPTRRLLFALAGAFWSLRLGLYIALRVTRHYPVEDKRYATLRRRWPTPAKFLLFIGDGTSSDIGLLGCVGESAGQDVWTNLTLEEISTPSVPLDKDSNDTVPLGLALDLSGTEVFKHKTASGEDSILPPPPVMYLYASDGTLVAWSVLNTRANPYPGMIAPSSSSDSMETATPTVQQPPVPSIQVNESTQPGSTTPPAQSTTATSAFGNTSGSAFGRTGFGNTSAFGSPGLSSGGFGQSSTFGSTSSTPVPQSTPGGFGAFASAGPSKFGFGSSSLAPPATAQPSPLISSPR